LLIPFFLSKEIAFEWATAKLIAKKEMLFLIILCDPLAQEIKTLAQFVCYAMKSSEINNTMTTTVQYLEDTSGKHYAIIVFDGHDLFEEKRNDLFVAKIVRHDILKLCSVVITSHLSASSSLHGDVDCRIEILDLPDEYMCQCLRGKTDMIKKIFNGLSIH